MTKIKKDRLPSYCIGPTGKDYAASCTQTLIYIYIVITDCCRGYMPFDVKPIAVDYVVIILRSR